MNKILLLTGSSRGLGRSLVKLLGKGNYIVYAGQRVIDSDVPSELHDKIFPLKFDVTDPASATAAAELIGARHGGVDVLVHNAAYGADFGRGPFRVDREGALLAFDTNVVAPIYITEAFLTLLKQRPGSTVAMVSSALGSFGQTLASAQDDPRAIGRSMIYASTKAALNMASLHLNAILVPQGIRLLILHPGWLQTDLGGARAPLTADEGAQFILDAIEAPPVPDENLGPRSIGGLLPW